MMDSHQIRRENARALAKEAGGPKKFEEAIKKSQSLVSRIIGEAEASQKDIGHSLAREIEKAFGKEYGWLDWPPVRRERQKYHDLIDSLDEEKLKIFDRLLGLSSRGWDWVDLAVRMARGKADEEKPSVTAEIHKLEQ